MKLRSLLLSLVLLTTPFFVSAYPNYDGNYYISHKEKSALHDCLMPLDHPAKPIVDALFGGPRVTTSIETLQAAGFQILRNQPRSFIIVAKHESLPGYLIKLYLDNDSRKKRGKPGWYWFSKRVHSIRQIENCIQQNNITHYKTPKKYVYPLPPSNNKYAKNFILIVEEMAILSDSDNEAAWKSWIKKSHLDELLTILDQCGGDSMRPRNLPFCTDGKIAFIDTEYPGKRPQYNLLTRYLSPKMQDYWYKITR